VPEVLLNGNHAEIRQWRRQRALDKTARLRPDLMPPAMTQDLSNKEVNDD
jgi:tRNA (guanine37-N1)-methyltransferase